jgi:hypothetical protein
MRLHVCAYLLRRSAILRASTSGHNQVSRTLVRTASCVPPVDSLIVASTS